MQGEDSIDVLANLMLDAYLLGRCGQEEVHLFDGRQWERAVGALLRQPSLTRRQYAGTTHLFQRTSLSGFRHELDGCASGWPGLFIVECKAKEIGVNKGDVALFHAKIFDYYLGNLDAATHEQWWCILVSASEVSDEIRRLCYQMRILLCDPGRLPLPVLVRVAGKIQADQHLRGVLLSELLHLGEGLCRPLQHQFQLTADGALSYHPVRRADLDELLWLQDELSSDVLDLYQRLRPERLIQRMEMLRIHL